MLAVVPVMSVVSSAAPFLHRHVRLEGNWWHALCINSTPWG